MDIDKDGLHPTELSRCCTARIRVVVHGPHGRYTDFICTKCEELCVRYTLTGAGAESWLPNGVLEGVGVTRTEWDDMQASTLPRVLAIEVMFKKAARRLQG